MKIFGFEFKTRRELKAEITRLENELVAVKEERELFRNELGAMIAVFPLEMGQTVYDVQLRNAKGRYVRKNPSLEHSIINEVVVNEENYFGLVERLNRNDVFFDIEDAKEYLARVCGNKTNS